MIDNTRILRPDTALNAFNQALRTVLTLSISSSTLGLQTNGLNRNNIPVSLNKPMIKFTAINLYLADKSATGFYWLNGHKQPFHGSYPLL